MDDIETSEIDASLQALEATYDRTASRNGIAVVDGHGLRVRVDRGHLELADGVGPYRRVRRFAKATHGLSRLVIVGASGSVSVEALSWCRRLGISVVVLDSDGTCVLASTPRTTDDARLRRIQALAPGSPVGLDLARWLISRKLSAQANLVIRRFPDASESAETIGALTDAVAGAADIEEIRQLEALGAALYFGSWSGRPECSPRFATQDNRRIPAHWTRYEGRRSVLTSANSNRKAERPVNSILNFLYALAESEAIRACAAVGLDPGFGFVHADARGRQSLALDLIEPIRPEIDSFALGLLECRTFRKVEFVETADGHVRLRPPLSHDLAETLPVWGRSVAPVAEHVAHALGRAMTGKYDPATPLTTRRHRRAQAIVKARKATLRQTAQSSVAHQAAKESPALPLWSCPDCGGPVANHRHVRCDTCMAADPSQSPAVRGRRGQAIAARKRALREWEKANPGTQYDKDLFRGEILPRLAKVKLSEIVEAAGCSKASASDIRAGKWLPHVSTWAALGALVGVSI